MVKWYVEGKSGSRVRPPRYWVSSSCSPLWRRYCHDDSPGNAGPWRRFYDTAERSGAGSDPADRLIARARPPGRVGGRLRSVGPMAATQGRIGHSGGVRHTSKARCGPVRACASAKPDGRVHAFWHAQRRAGAVGGVVSRPAVAQPAAAGRPPAQRAGLSLAQEPFGRAISHELTGRAADRRTPGRTAVYTHNLNDLPRESSGSASPGASGGQPRWDFSVKPTTGRSARLRGGEP